MENIDLDTIISIKCPTHGAFDMRAGDHIGENKERIAYGCPTCGDEKPLDKPKDEKEFTLKFTLSEFEELSNTSCRSFYNKYMENFEPVDDYDLLPSTDDGWMLYFVGPEIFAAMVAEKILKAANIECFRVFSLTENPEPEWCILTQYKSQCWQQMEKRN